MVAPQRATVVLDGPISIKGTGRTLGQDKKQTLWGNAGLFQALTTLEKGQGKGLVIPWGTLPAPESFLSCLWFHKIYKLFVTDVAISCTALFHVSWVFPFRKKCACVLILYSHCCSVNALSCLLFVLFWDGFFGSFVSLDFLNIWYGSHFSFACLFSLYVLHLLLLKMCPHFIENKSPSYFLLDCQDFSFKAHWLH